MSPLRHLPVVGAEGQLLGLLTRESVCHILQPVDLFGVRFVLEVMTSEVICAVPTASILHLAKLMAAYRVSSVVIAENFELPPTESERLKEPRVKLDRRANLIPIGIVTERDIVQFQALELDLQRIQAQTVMSTSLFCLKLDNSLWVAHQEMQRRCIQQLVVTGDLGELLGIITQTSLLGVMDPVQMFGAMETLQRRTIQLEAEKLELLRTRNIELEEQVRQRIAEMQARKELKDFRSYREAGETRVVKNLHLATIRYVAKLLG